jgi:hypothetical protein
MNINNNPRILLHSMQIYWYNVSNILYQSGCNDDIINMSIEIGNNYKNDVDYKNLTNVFITNMKQLLIDQHFFTMVRNNTITAIQNNERVPYDFASLIDI